MLSSLQLRDLAIVHRLELEFGPGLNVLTGETGAGKSILVQALSLLLGGRGSSEWVRAGSEEASVEGVFELSAAVRDALLERGLQAEGPELLVRRTIHKNGKGRVFLNGQLATVTLLQEIMRGTIDISGQHEHVSLFREEHHLDLLDAYAGTKPLAAELAALYREQAALLSELESERRATEERARREDYLRFQLEELRELQPSEGELEDLEVERQRLRHARRLQEVSGEAECVLYSGEDAIVDRLGRVERDLQEASALDDRLSPLAARMALTLSEVGELARELGRYAHGVDLDPARLEHVEERIESLRRLAKKHGGSLERAMAAQSEMEAELRLIEETEERCLRGHTRLGELGSELEARAQALSAARRRGAEKLEKALRLELEGLSLTGSSLEVKLTPLAELSVRGAERAAFLFAPNAGEPARPLAKTASGGELSRVLLALKVVLASNDGVSTYVFDEVDSGIGGRVASVLGQKLEDVARSRQVLCITHLPQVAAYADRHLRVSKEIERGRTTSRVEVLEPQASIEELARMLAGSEVTPRSIELAGELRARAMARRTPGRAPSGRGRRRRAA